MIEPEELRSFFRGLETRDVELVADIDPQEVYAGNVVYRASNGWVLTVFNDANEFDYVDEVVTSDGRRMEFRDLLGTDLDWRLEEGPAWRCLGIPGYCTFRCTECGARIPDAVERPRAMTAPFLCGDSRCSGALQPPNGTWIRCLPAGPVRTAAR